MEYSFNLVDRPWIPCLCLDGQMRELSLRETLLSAHELRGIQGDSPLETAALYRLLLAVLHSAFRGPRSQAEWADLWQAGRLDAARVGGYLDQWRDRFDLFDAARPFYQAKDARVKPKSVISLVVEMASGNNAVLFDHHTEADGISLTPTKAARTLLVAQSFGLAGLSGLEQKFTDGPWGRGVIFLVEGENVFQTLALNLLKYSETEPFLAQGADRPAWEQEDPFEPNRQIPFGYLDYLTWQNRRIWLFPEGDLMAPVVRGMTQGPGLRLDSLVLDPMKHYHVDKDRGYLVLRFREDRMLWRDSLALFKLQNGTSERPPETFPALARLVDRDYLHFKQLYRFMALGMANDQAKVEFFREEHLPLPLAYLERAELVEQLSEAMTLAENCRSALWKSVSLMALLVVSPKSDGKNWKDIDRVSKDQAGKLYEHWAVERFYWSRLELPFLRLLVDLPARVEAGEEDPGAAWKATVRQITWAAFARAEGLAGTDAAGLKAAVRARGTLIYSLKEIYSEGVTQEATV